MGSTGWRIASRRRPILCDQEKEALSQRIAQYWSAHGKTAASMIIDGSSSSNSSSNKQEGNADEASTDPQSRSTEAVPSPSSIGGHNFMPLPEILFGQSFLELQHTTPPSQGGAQTDFCLRFNTTGALLLWAWRHVDGAAAGGATPLEVIRVPEASRWAAGNLAAGLKQVRYDWVFGTDYEGELMVGGCTPADPCDTLLDSRDAPRGGGQGWEPADASVIDRALLQRQDMPILFYDDITLYEDELHDHGVVSLNAKVRVMPTCWFVLLRYFLRVDGVLLRVHDTRYFHKFGEGWVGKETTRKEIQFAQLREAGLSTDTSEYRDANKVASLSVGPAPAVVQARFVLPGAPS